MHKSLNSWLDLCILIVMLAVSAVITMTSVSMIVGDTANIIQDKVLVDAGQQIITDKTYTVSDILLSTTRMDLVNPVEKYVVTFKDRSISFMGKDNSVVVQRDSFAKQIMSLRGTIETDVFYTYPVKMQMSYEKDTGLYTCNITIEEVP